MGSTIHFFIPLGEMIPVPDRFSRTRKPSAVHDVNTDSPYPSSDGVHFVFHRVEIEAPPHLGLEASLMAASRRVGNMLHRDPRPKENNKNYQTVVEAMVEIEDSLPPERKHEVIQLDSSSQTVAFDHAIEELNVLLRAIAFVQRYPIKSVSRESIAPMIPVAFSTRKPWEMIGNEELPDLKPGPLFVLNSNCPLSPEALGNVEELDLRIDAALVHLSSNGPFATYLDFRREAGLYHSRDGNYRAATIMYAAACESLLEDLLQHTLWEQGVRPEKAKKRFVTKKGYPQSISYLVKKELGSLYASGGWQENGPEAIVAWSTHVAQLRNRAVHEGYAPNVEEMKKCVVAVDQLVTFVGDQVFKTRLKRPLTALAFLGRDGFEARKGWNHWFSKIQGSLEDVNVRLKTFRRWSNALSSLRSRERPSLPSVEDSTCLLVFEPTGQQSFYLIEDQGVRAERIVRENVVFPPDVEQVVRTLEQSEAPAIPSVYTLPFDSIEVKEPNWKLYTYDVIPGFEVLLAPTSARNT